MSKPESELPKFVISLRENGVHSFLRGIELTGSTDEHKDNFALKDAVMFLHHGVELLMKEILRSHSPFLIFEDLRDAATKQKQADATGVGIFYLDKSPKTVSYEEAIKRVSAFIKPQELTLELQTDLTTLNKYRNQIEHYAVDADTEDLVKLLVALREPLLELFEKHVGNIRNQQSVSVEKAWSNLQKSARFFSKFEEEVFGIVGHFHGQIVPGRLFNIVNDLTLPTFTRLLLNDRVLVHGKQYQPDILGEGEGLRWIVEIKGALRDTLGGIAQVSSIAHILDAQQSWLVVFNEISEIARAIANSYGVLITGEKEWEELKRLVLTA